MVGGIDYVKIAGVDSREFGMYAFQKPYADGARRVLEETVIPGRNGTLKRDTGRWANIRLTYDFVIPERGAEMLARFRAFLFSLKEYFRVEDSFNPEEFYLCAWEEEFLPDVTKDGSMAKVKIRFDRKPQRWLKSGEEKHEFASGVSEIDNPTAFPAAPLIRVYGTGGATIGTYPFVCSEDFKGEYIDIDCDRLTISEGSFNRGSYISLSDHVYPIIRAGGCAVRSSFTKMEITPRYYTL